jgi:hypothetical protein
MSAAETVVSWFLASPRVPVSLLTYHVLEGVVQKALTLKCADRATWIDRARVGRFHTGAEPTPEVRGYASSELFRQDTLTRLRQIYNQVAPA